MPRLNTRHNFRVEVQPRSPSDFGMASIGGVTRSEAESERMCEQIASEIRRHVEDLPSSWSQSNRGVSVIWDNEPVCSHCGSAWTEKSADYNGGCCDRDEDANPDFDKYGNPTDGSRLINCCFPDCGCDGARLCSAENGASSGALTLNLEKRR